MGRADRGEVPKPRAAARAQVGAHDIVFSLHAVEQYAARVRHDAAPVPACAEEIERLAPSIGEVVERAPDWLIWRDEEEAGFLHMTDDVVFPLMVEAGRPVAITCVTKGEPTDETRRRRRERKHKRTRRDHPAGGGPRGEAARRQERRHARRRTRGAHDEA